MEDLSPLEIIAGIRKRINKENDIKEKKRKLPKGKKELRLMPIYKSRTPIKEIRVLDF